MLCAHYIFQRKLDETFRDIPGVAAVADDFVISDCDLADHDANLKAVMERDRKIGARFNAHKCKIRCTEIPFFGLIINSSGLRPYPQKVEVISSIHPSSSIAYLQTFLGMTHFLSHNLPKIASHSATLWDLTKRNSEIEWQPQNQQAVDKIKKAITSAYSLPILRQHMRPDAALVQPCSKTWAPLNKKASS